MKKILKTGILVLAVLALLLPAALAEDIVISERLKAIRLADKALEEKYGITMLGQEYLERDTEDGEDGTYTVRYKGKFDLGYVLGTYEVTVKNGTVTGIAWSHDGEDTSGGLKAEAWGIDQIMEMLKLNQETWDDSGFADQAKEINAKHGFVYSMESISDTLAVMQTTGYESYSKEARDLAALLPEQVSTIAKQALIRVFELNEAQQAHMEVMSEPDSQGYGYIMYHGVPCQLSCIGVGDGDAAPEVLPNGLLYTEKDGTYWVCVNVQTGVVEDIFYSAGIGGNG